MAARSIGSGTISFGLVSIPVKLYTATSPKSVHFHMLVDKTGHRVKQRLVDAESGEVVERDETIKGYEYAKDQFVRFTNEELRKLEAERTNAIEIAEFVPIDTVDPLYFEKTYFLGPDKGGVRAYQLLGEAMNRTGKVAVARYASRGRDQLVIVRPYQKGLSLHYVFYADEVRSIDEVELGDAVTFKQGEIDLADRLIESLAAEAFEPKKYEDTYRKRVLDAVDQKVAGEEITVVSERPVAQIIDLFDALKASLGEAKKRRPAANDDGGDAERAGAASEEDKPRRGGKRAAAKESSASSPKPLKKAQTGARSGRRKAASDE